MWKLKIDPKFNCIVKLRLHIKLSVAFKSLQDSAREWGGERKSTLRWEKKRGMPKCGRWYQYRWCIAPWPACSHVALAATLIATTLSASIHSSYNLTTTHLEFAELIEAEKFRDKKNRSVGYLGTSHASRQRAPTNFSCRFEVSEF